MSPTPRPNPGALRAALAELGATAEALRALATSRTLRLLAGEGKYDRLSKDVHATHVLMVRLEPLTEQVYAHSRLDIHWRTGRLDHRGLGPVARSPEAQARQLIRTLVWRSFTPEQRRELSGLIWNMDIPRTGTISEPYRALVSSWCPRSMMDWMGLASMDQRLEATIGRLSAALEGGDHAEAQAIATRLAPCIPHPEDAHKTPPRWSKVIKESAARHQVRAGQRLADLMRRPLGPGAAHPAPAPQGAADQHWRPTAAWYQTLNEQRVRAGLRPYPHLGLRLHS